MSQQHSQAYPLPEPEQRGALSGSTLNLPRMSFAPATPAPAPQRPAHQRAAHQPAPLRSTIAPLFVNAPAPRRAPGARHAAATQHPARATYARAQVPAAAPAPTYAPIATTALMPAVAHPTSYPAAQPAHAPMQAPAPAQMYAAAPTPTPTIQRSPTISWAGLEPSTDPPTLLQRITPLHMGLALIAALVLLIASSSPSGVRATTTSLPSIVSGGGSAIDPTTAGAQAVAARGRARGIPSPAASANIAASRGLRASRGSTSAIRMKGIPSSTAAAAMGPQTLPFRPSDNVTMPRTFTERDSHAVEEAYGSDVLAMEPPVELPAMSPGEAIARDELRAARFQLTGEPTPTPTPTGGLPIPF